MAQLEGEWLYTMEYQYTAVDLPWSDKMQDLLEEGCRIEKGHSMSIQRLETHSVFSLSLSLSLSS